MEDELFDQCDDSTDSDEDENDEQIDEQENEAHPGLQGTQFMNNLRVQIALKIQ